MIDSEISVQGYAFFHPEETLLCPKNAYASAPFVELDLSALVQGETPQARVAKRRELAARFEAKWVIVRGVLRVGPYGMLSRPMVYIDVARIEEANQPPQRNAGSRPPSGDSPASETPSSLGPRG
jgi:hypothetical protein